MRGPGSARVLGAVVALCAVLAAACGPTEAETSADPLYWNAAYSVDADPFADLDAAKADAAATGRRILVEVGGDWCSWCHILDAYLEDNADVRAAFARSFLVLRVNWSPENENHAFLDAFPEITGYPHFFVLDAEGTLLHSQNTAELEEGPSYDHAAMMRFAEDWRAP